MYTIRKLFKFEGAHILTSAYSEECTVIHGHSYKVALFLSSEYLNSDGMVVDFKLLKDTLGHILSGFDHKLVIQNTNPFLENGLIECGVVKVDFNPTAENMAKYFYDQIKMIIPTELIVKVRVYETDTGYAEYWN